MHGEVLEESQDGGMAPPISLELMEAGQEAVDWGKVEREFNYHSS